MTFINPHQVWTATKLRDDSQARRRITDVYQDELQRDPTEDELTDVLWRSGAYAVYEKPGYRPRQPIDSEQDLRDELSGSPSPPTPGPALDPLVVSGKILTLNGQPFDWREISYFTVQPRIMRGEAASVLTELQALRVWGFTGIRAFGMLGHPFWHSVGLAFGPHDVGYVTALTTLVDLCRQAGLYLDYAVFCDTGYVPGMDSQNNRLAHASMVRDLLKPSQPMLEVSNEPEFNGFTRGDPDLTALGQVLAPATTMLALGSESGFHGHELTYDHAPADVVAFHAERKTEFDGWNWVKRMGEYPVCVDGDRPALNAEPINAGDKGRAHPKDFEPNAAIWFTYGALSRIVPSHGYAPTFHYHDGLFSKLPTGNTLECLDAFMDGCDTVPLSSRGLSWTNGHWSGAPWAGYDQTDPPSDDRPFRIFGRGTGSSYIGVALRHPVGWTWSNLRYPVQKIAEVGPSGGGKFAASVWKGV